jgi:hypothetical protein
LTPFAYKKEIIMNTATDNRHEGPDNKNIYFPIGHHVASPGASKKASGKYAAVLYFQELLDSVESLTGIAEEHGARTLADLMYLHHAILTGGFIDQYPDESKVLEIASALPSGDRWSKFIQAG